MHPQYLWYFKILETLKVFRGIKPQISKNRLQIWNQHVLIRLDSKFYAKQSTLIFGSFRLNGSFWLIKGYFG